MAASFGVCCVLSWGAVSSQLVGGVLAESVKGVWGGEHSQTCQCRLVPIWACFLVSLILEGGQCILTVLGFPLSLQVNMDKLKERAQRFGLNVSSLSKKVRPVNPPGGSVLLQTNAAVMPGAMSEAPWLQNHLDSAVPEPSCCSSQ